MSASPSLSICNNSIGQGESIALPGPKKRQAEALFQNIKWLAETFGPETIGFLTLTFAKPCFSRRIASRRFNSVLNILRKRYRCGVTVSERHKSGAIHFHLVVTVGRDIRTGIDFEAVFPARASAPARSQARARRGAACVCASAGARAGALACAACEGASVRGVRADYSTAPAALRAEWHWLRKTLHRFGFGRHQLQPMKFNTEALARYVGKYISKSWEFRTDDDKGARLLRYFGRWTKGEARKASPPWSARHAGLSPRARAWRQCMAQIALSCQLQGVNFTEQTVRQFVGRRWAWHTTRRIRATLFFNASKFTEQTRQGVRDHNAEVSAEHEGRERHVSERPAEFWCESWHADGTDTECRQARAGNNRSIIKARQDKAKVNALLEALADWTQPVRPSISCGVQTKSAPPERTQTDRLPPAR